MPSLRQIPTCAAPTVSFSRPSPVNPPSGCCFHTRCPYATERCRTEKPELKAYGDRMAACHRIGEACMADL